MIEAIEQLRNEGASLSVGYEANGGFILGGTVVGDDGRPLARLPTRDAMTLIVAMLSAMTTNSCTLSALGASLPERVTASDRLLSVAANTSDRLLATLAVDAAAQWGLLEDIAARPVSVDTLDGVRMTLASGDIVHLRASGNAPELRFYCEAGSQGMRNGCCGRCYAVSRCCSEGRDGRARLTGLPRWLDVNLSTRAGNDPL